MSKSQLLGFCLAQFLKRFRAVNQQRNVVACNISGLCADPMIPATNITSVLSDCERGWFLFRDVQEYSVLSTKEGKFYRYTKGGK